MKQRIDCFASPAQRQPRRTSDQQQRDAGTETEADRDRPYGRGDARRAPVTLAPANTRPRNDQIGSESLAKEGDRDFADFEVRVVIAVEIHERPCVRHGEVGCERIERDLDERTVGGGARSLHR